MSFYKTLEKKGWDNYVTGIYDYYNGRTSDSQVILVEPPYGSREKWDKFEKFLEAYCYSNDLEWAYGSDTYIDYDDNCAYDIGYGESDVIFSGYEYIGRRMIENEHITWKDLKELFEDDCEKALPSWFPNKQMFMDGYEKLSCEFQDGWYGQNDKPDEIAQKLYDKGYEHVVFQIESCHMFATNFCVWAKEKDEE